MFMSRYENDEQKRNANIDNKFLANLVNLKNRKLNLRLRMYSL
jgi:hypothetical protein